MAIWERGAGGGGVGGGGLGGGGGGEEEGWVGEFAAANLMCNIITASLSLKLTMPNQTPG